MKYLVSTPVPIRRKPHGFTLIEILIVVGLILILLAMVVMLAPTIARSAKRKKAEAQITLIDNGLKRYKTEFGEYPRVAGGGGDPKAMGACLYQALTGDGSDMIDGAEQVSSSGNAGMTTDGTVFLEEAVFDPSNPINGFVHKDYYLQDPFLDPFRYRKAEDGVRTSNPDYDLWSIAGDKQERDPETWITNWD